MARLSQVPGVTTHQVDLKNDSATVVYDPARATIDDLKRAVSEAGFLVREVQEVRQ